MKPNKLVILPNAKKESGAPLFFFKLVCCFFLVWLGLYFLQVPIHSVKAYFGVFLIAFAIAG